MVFDKLDLSDFSLLDAERSDERLLHRTNTIDAGESDPVDGNYKRSLEVESLDEPQADACLAYRCIGSCAISRPHTRSRAPSHHCSMHILSAGGTQESLMAKGMLPHCYEDLWEEEHLP